MTALPRHAQADEIISAAVPAHMVPTEGSVQVSCGRIPILIKSSSIGRTIVAITMSCIFCGSAVAQEIRDNLVLW